ncbi:MAG: ParA family protein [Anaerolineales bacterium]|uniref:ParA family protein n=1 Tax=Candidatus Villigracilis proximus TaxID=3140683 RepID=UPI0031353B07|nr:ParA family protein [Anaerolineales bacterium]MBK8821536.1 ParA family protein [Anaerolineales bacterium]MBK9209272.1 ParA family protein [Anaerolineales bacterium]
MLKTIAISNEKGGVAKTTTTLSLGASLADMGHRVLLIDMDAQANLTLSLGFEPGEAEYTSSEIMLDNIPLISARHKTDIENLDLIQSNSRIETSEQFLPMRTNYTTILQRAIANMGNQTYNYILLDCPPALGAITQNALAAADLLLIPTQAEYFSAYALRNMMSLIRRIREGDNPNLAYRILVTMLDKRNRTHRNIHDQLRSTFGEGVFNTVIEIDTKLRESPIAGLPISHYKPGARGTTQYRILAQELLEYAKETENRQTA